MAKKRWENGMRCTCGHYPTAHMVIAPVEGNVALGFCLTPIDKCAICGPVVCPHFTMSALPPSR